DENEDVRILAASALGKQSTTLPDSALQALISALRDENWYVKDSATRALVNQSALSSSALLVIISVMQNENKNVSESAASALGERSTLSNSDLQVLIGALQDENENVRHLAASALEKQSTLPDSALQALIDALKDENRDVRQSAVFALENQSTLPDLDFKALIGALSDKDWGIRISAASILGKQSTLPDSAIQALIDILQFSDINRCVSQILEQHVKLTFMAIPRLPPSSIGMLYTYFLVFYGSQNSAALWVQDNQMFFYTAQGFEKVEGLCVEDIQQIVIVFVTTKVLFLLKNGIEKIHPNKYT
ncbi:hypothetical protein BGZ49_001363, partial [Haplosporangium sp. Z 27]